jgi:hypothetical protein
MNRRQIRDHRRIPLRFRFTSKRGSGTTTWPLLRKDPETGKQPLNPSVHVASVITMQGRKIDV